MEGRKRRRLEERAQSSQRAVILSDNEKLVRDIGVALLHEAIHPIKVRDAQEAVRRVYDSHPLVLIAEDRMSNAGNIDLCQWLRRLPCVGTILLGDARKGPQVVNGLDRGADFYVATTSSTQEIIACVKAVIRRRGGWPPNVVRLLDTQHRCALAGDVWVELTGTEFRLLSYLVLNQDRVVPAEEILAHVWPGEQDMSSLGFHIHKLRQKLNHKTQSGILTRFGVGYRFASPASVGSS